VPAPEAEGQEGRLSTEWIQCQHFRPVHVHANESLIRKPQTHYETLGKNILHCKDGRMCSQLKWPIAGPPLEKVAVLTASLNCPSPFLNSDPTSCAYISELVRLILPTLGHTIAHKTLAIKHRLWSQYHLSFRPSVILSEQTSASLPRLPASVRIASVP
jgi:hypothetical protein